MEHNQYLNEILNLITKYYEDHKIKNNDLQKISQLVSDLTNKSNKKNNDFLEINNYSATVSLSEIDIEIEDIVANGLNTKFRTSFNETSNPKLWKVFSIKKDFFDLTASNTVLRFIEYKNSFELARLDNNGNAFLISQDNRNLGKENGTDFKGYMKALEDNGIGKQLDDKLQQLSGQAGRNTRRITIPYETNFDTSDSTGKDYVNFLPAIDENHKFTFIMFFGDKLNEMRHFEAKETYYDTFQLCPPGTC